MYIDIQQAGGQVDPVAVPDAEQSSAHGHEPRQPGRVAHTRQRQCQHIQQEGAQVVQTPGQVHQRAHAHERVRIFNCYSIAAAAETSLVIICAHLE